MGKRKSPRARRINFLSLFLSLSFTRFFSFDPINYIYIVMYIHSLCKRSDSRGKGLSTRATNFVARRINTDVLFYATEKYYTP